MGHQIHLQKPRPSIAPIRKRADGDLTFEQRAGLGCVEPTSFLHRLTRRLQRTIDGGCTHASYARLDRDRELAQGLPLTQTP